jgi:methylmalonyl-CoA/ethylmalonyl-CoA epimerase
MAKVIKINHVAVAVNEIEPALTFWRDALGLEIQRVEDVPSQKSTVAFLPVGDSEIELVKPTDASTGLAKFLQEKGPGIHHLCVQVDDIQAMLAQLKEKGVRLINDNPQVLPSRKMAFIHPKSTGGVLVELYELIDDDQAV